MQTIVYLISCVWFPMRARGTYKPQRRSIETRREERELLFWTIRETLALLGRTLMLILLAVLILHAITSVAEGGMPSIQEIASALRAAPV